MVTHDQHFCEERTRSSMKEELWTDSLAQGRPYVRHAIWFEQRGIPRSSHIISFLLTHAYGESQASQTSDINPLSIYQYELM